MAGKEIFDLADLAAHALEYFPEEFGNVSDPKLYKFETAKVVFDNGTSAQQELLRIAYGDMSAVVSRWAGLQNGKITYYSGYRVTGVRAIAPLTHKESEMLYYLGPFRFVVSPDCPRDTVWGYIDAISKRLLEYLVKFAFLITGRVAQMSFPREQWTYNEDELSGLKEFEWACMTIRINMLALITQADEGPSLPVRLSLLDSAENAVTSAAIRNGNLIEEAENRIEASTLTAIRSVFEKHIDTEDEQGTYNTCSSKRRKRSHSELDVPSTALTSIKATAPSDKVQELLDAVVAQCKTELSDSWAQERGAFRQENERLAKQLSEKEKKLSEKEKALAATKREREEWKAEFLKLDAGMRNLVNDK